MLTSIRPVSHGSGEVQNAMQRFTKALMSAVILVIAGNAQATETLDPQPTVVLFENVRIFDGTSEQLSKASNVLVAGNIIQRISSEPIAIPAQTQGVRIDGAGRTLMPRV